MSYRLFKYVDLKGNTKVYKLCYADFSMNGPVRTGRYCPLTEEQSRITVFVLSYFIVECETGGPYRDDSYRDKCVSKRVLVKSW